LSNGFCQKRFPDPGWADQENVLMPAYPVRVLNQRPDHLLVQATHHTEINILDTGWALQPAISEPPLQGPVLPPVPLPVHQQRKTFLEAELPALWIFLLLCKTVGHAAHAHGIQLLYRLLVEHISPCRLYGTTGGSTSGGESK
jgi:hypothetical protein